MCAGALVAARVAPPRRRRAGPEGRRGRLALQPRAADPRLNHEVAVTYGVLAEECAEVLQAFFAERR